MKFELNEQGVRELMLSSEMTEICQSYANKALNTLGSGYTSDVHVGKNRVNVEVKAQSKEAGQDNLDNNTIWKAVNASK